MPSKKVLHCSQLHLYLIFSNNFKNYFLGFTNGICTGPILNFPVLGANVILESAFIKRSVPEPLISAAMVEAMKKVLKKSDVGLLEPYMKLTIHTEPEVCGALINDLALKRGEILNQEDLKSMTILNAKAPLSELRGYSTQLRIVSSGKAFFGMEFSHYESMDKINQNKAIEDVTGFKPKM